MTQVSPVLPTANICWQDNTPYSLDFDDYYYSKINGVEESNYVFVRGNHLTQRWQEFEIQQQNQFSIFETGFGSGLNFLVTAQHWSDFQNQHTTKYLKKLIFTSVEAHPLKIDDLNKVIVSWQTEFKLTNALIQFYPPALKGVYSLDFGNIELKLILMPFDQAIAAIEPKGKSLFDCLFLDGFAPIKNESMWQADLLRRLSYFCKNSSTFSSFTAASQVQKNLKNCDYQIKKIKGYGSKREMLTGVLRRNEIPVYKSKHPWYEYTDFQGLEKPIIIIGAGIAGCATAFALSKRGIHSIVIDSQPEPGGTITDFPVSSFSPYLSADFNTISQFYWSGYHLLTEYLSQRDYIEHKFTGVFYLADNQEQLATLKSVHSLLAPSGLKLKWLEADQTEQFAGMKISFPGLLNPDAGWVNPKELCKSFTDSSWICVQMNSKVHKIDRNHGHWRVQTNKNIFTSDHVILCMGANTDLFDCYNLCSLDHIKGQLSSIHTTDELSSLQVILNNGHYLIPNQNNILFAGSNYIRTNSDSSEPTIQADIENLNAFKGINPGLDHLTTEQIDRLSKQESSKSQHGMRLASRDHLPVVGPVPDMGFYQQHYPQFIQSGRLKDCPDPKHVGGLFVNTAHGSRGVTGSLLSGQIIASLLTGSQLPLPTKLYHAVHPARFFIRDISNLKLLSH